MHGPEAARVIRDRSALPGARVIRVAYHQTEIGNVGADFLEALDAGNQGPAAFMLGGRAWQIKHVDWTKGLCLVTPAPAPAGKAPRWKGSPQFLHYDLCQAMRALLVSDTNPPEWTERARTAMATLRAEHAFLADQPSSILREGQDIKWWTFAGGRANNLLAKLIEEELGGQCTVRNSSITCKDAAAASEVAFARLHSPLGEGGAPESGRCAAARSERGAITGEQIRTVFAGGLVVRFPGGDGGG